MLPEDASWAVSALLELLPWKVLPGKLLPGILLPGKLLPGNLLPGKLLPGKLLMTLTLLLLLTRLVLLSRVRLLSCLVLLPALPPGLDPLPRLVAGLLVLIETPILSQEPTVGAIGTGFSRDFLV